MIARSSDIDRGAGGNDFARTMLNMAAEVERAESDIKAAILAAAQAGDCARIIEIMSRWQTLPAAEVLMPKEPQSKRKRLDS